MTGQTILYCLVCRMRFMAFHTGRYIPMFVVMAHAEQSTLVCLLGFSLKHLPDFLRDNRRIP